MGCGCAFGWVCDIHPGEPWPHGDCPGPGVPCRADGCRLSLAGLTPADPLARDVVDAQLAASGARVVCRAGG
jgi:hypothetical protein